MSVDEWNKEDASCLLEDGKVIVDELGKQLGRNDIQYAAVPSSMTIIMNESMTERD